MKITKMLDREIASVVGRDNLLDDDESLDLYGKDASTIKGRPHLVVRPSRVEEVSAVMKIASKAGVPVTPRGLGTGLAGGAVPINGGIVISFERMKDLQIDPENLTAEVEPGVVNGDLKKEALRFDLFYPPDPASYETCSIGGNVATNAGGPACVKYGTTRDYVLGLQLVMPSGDVMNVGVKTRKGVVGYDLTRLIVGSEGTLALITKIWLRLLAKPPALTAIVALFPSLKAAMETVTSILIKGYMPSAVEFMDKKCLDLVKDQMPFSFSDKVEAILLVELDGVPSVIERDAEKIGEISLDCGASDVYLAPDSQKRLALWAIRREVSLRIERSAHIYIPEDIVVPIDKIASFVEQLPFYEKMFYMRIYTFGHAGDGNIHLNITADKDVPMDKIENGTKALLELAVKMGGTISGEHGVGCLKKKFMPIEIPIQSIKFQKSLKKLFDPKGILNPGKIF